MLPVHLTLLLPSLEPYGFLLPITYPPLLGLGFPAPGALACALSALCQHSRTMLGCFVLCASPGSRCSHDLKRPSCAFLLTQSAPEWTPQEASRDIFRPSQLRFLSTRSSPRRPQAGAYHTVWDGEVLRPVFPINQGAPEGPSSLAQKKEERSERRQERLGGGCSSEGARKMEVWARKGGKEARKQRKQMEEQAMTSLFWASLSHL